MTDLAGLHILVTRPAGQAQGLMDKLAALGARPLHFAAVEIVEPHDIAGLKAVVADLAAFDWAIFISPNAVTRAFNLMQGWGQAWPAKVRMAAIGRGSARELQRLGFRDILVPEGRFDSESLLSMSPLQDMQGKGVVVFRGEGGRELLGDTLAARGARVRYAECYRRAAPSADISGLLRAWARHGLDAVIVTSVEGLHHLYDALGQVGRQWLTKTPLVVVGTRQRDACRALGLQGPLIVAAGADDETLIAALCSWHAGKNPL
ncbi:uroporphyrinogen-III synthase [Acidiferrobacter thiooxydans]|uniref:Uroporphyrinogen-III synthase n=1 Tax=Acidiferrobacter thiooxydans TaxID=163359 RepID=A0A368HK72_9GAMM|nr:uroporphyrinogen-III synthase [Acidiferrobacter thiooxydans]RCN58547.1 uroporphyrinogen III synthase [Acidiferrobacter thiooxydans]UEO00161.1 uroporphyrinogen-III synthase [Acidiferrobacter thiooxydans]